MNAPYQEGNPRSAALLIRVWTESDAPGALRARLLTLGDRHEPTTWSTAAGDAAITQEVLRWLRDVRGERGRAHASPSNRTVAPVVTGAWLQEHLDDPDVAVVQVVEDADRLEEGHLPGAVRLHWIEDLQHPVRRTFVAPDAFAALMEARGIAATSHVVVCAGVRNPLAASVYWCFAYYGHPRLSLLDGGRSAWRAEGRPLAPQPSSAPPRSGYPVPAGRPEILVTRDEVLERVVEGRSGSRLVDCRSPQEYAGQPVQAYDLPVARHRVSGHVPGAVNLPAEELLDPVTGRLRGEAELRGLCREHGLSPSDSLVVYCGVTDRSALVWFTLHEVLGWPDVRCYYGAWAEYGSLADVPVERGLPSTAPA